MAFWAFILMCFLSIPSSAIGVQGGDANVTTECSETSMTVTVEVDSNFNGVVYAKDHEDDCAYSLVSGSTTVYQRSFEYSSTDCGETLTTQADQSREFSLTTIVRYNTDILIQDDRNHDSTCTFSDEQSVYTNLGTVNGSESNLESNKDTVDGELASRLAFTLQSTDGTVGDSDEVRLGEELTMKIDFGDNPLFETMLVTDCVASNRKDNSSGDYVSLELIGNEGCLANDNLDLVVPQEPVYILSPGNSVQPYAMFTFSLLVKAFMFVEGRMGDKNELHFACDVRLCPPVSGESPCDYNSRCGDGNVDSPSRRRRSADEVFEVNKVKLMGTVLNGEEIRLRRAEDTEFTKVGGATTVVSGADTVERATAKQIPADLDECLNNHEMQSIIVAMGIALLALLMVVITLVILFCRRRGRHGDEAKQVDDGLSMGSSRQGLAPDHSAKHGV
ncbi:EGF-like domain-containing protein 2 [Littorina saxatilis]|uniref:ZP domain-containing protein n=1 Tax=Littorina saxatilis TaxID=31220 RepID=A0AAN9FWZ3_9CAEN